MFAGAYTGRRVFVTGHTGFKGSWLTQWLLDLEAEVTGFALDPPTQPNLFNAIGLGRQPVARAVAGAGQTGRRENPRRGVLRDGRGDVRDRPGLASALRAARPEIVFHLAAQPLVRRSYAEPHLTFETNVMGTVNVLEAAREAAAEGAGPRAVVVVTSDKCYENAETTRAYREGDPLGGRDPYAASKGAAELVAAAYRRSYFSARQGPQVATARAGNVIGGGDWGEDRLLPDCVRALSAGRSVEIRNPEAVRPWQHVLEPLSGYLWLGARLAGGRGGESGEEDGGAEPAGGGLAGAWNFGPGPEGDVTVREVVEAFLAAWGGGEWRPAAGAAEQPHEAGLLLLDASKAAERLGWRPIWNASQAVASAAAWYRHFADGGDQGLLLSLMRADIKAYTDEATQRRADWAR